jgi:hypothetical protein
VGKLLIMVNDFGDWRPHSYRALIGQPCVSDVKVSGVFSNAWLLLRSEAMNWSPFPMRINRIKPETGKRAHTLNATFLTIFHSSNQYTNNHENSQHAPTSRRSPGGAAGYHPGDSPRCGVRTWFGDSFSPGLPKCNGVLISTPQSMAD